ncbi:MAG: hypothetical protein ACYSSI_00205 [Planctomycetota bacterium]|jgi:hypothetical protein
MTDLEKPVSRVSRGCIRECGKPREIVITLMPPNVLYFRAKGCRRKYALTAEACYMLAVKAHVADEKKLKKKARKKRA